MRRHSRERRGGAALIEFTLIAPFLTLLLLGAWNYGYAFFRYSQLEEAVRDGARFASIRRLDDNSPALYTKEVQCVVATGTPNCSAASVVPGLTFDKVAVRRFPSTGRPTEIEVSVTTFPIAEFFPVNVINKPRARFPYGGIYAPKT